jgi:flagellar biosynthesis protein FlhF
MRIKKYVADSMPEVLKLVKDNLGPKAVVLNTRTLAKSGILGKKGQVEVTAAVDDSPRAKPHKKSNAPAKRTVKKAERKTAPLVDSSPSPVRTKPAMPQAVLTQAPPSPDTLARISAQLKELQAKMQSPVDRSQTLSSGMLPEALGSIATQMEQDDLDHTLTESVVKDLLTDPGEEGFKSPGALKRKAVRMLSDRMPPGKPTTVSGKIRSVIALVGTSGAGKTTASAKLAAHFVAQGKRVALISTDTHRVGGLEQIRAYGSILDLPVDLAYTPDEMREVMQNRRDTDLIILDTAGISPGDAGQKEVLKDVLREAAPNEIHLVMSAPTGLRQMRDAVCGFKEIGIDRLLFTRLDETQRYGAACSVAIESGISVSFVTNSRDVPGDLHEADPTTLTKALLVRSLNGTAGS